uniref:NAC domain-containing protein n=1 Tax=Oryza barthii TaxID=65489 RepID=A0A0D3HR57_9ORYZ
MVDKLLALGVPLGMNKDSPYTSPSLAAEAVARLHMPPMLLMVAEKDLLHDPQVEYGEAMARVGKTVETVVSRGAVAHVFYLNFFAERQEAANPTTTTRTLVESITNWIRVYSDGSVDRLGPPEAAAFMVLVPPYDDPRDGVTVHDVATDHGVDVRLYLTGAALFSFISTAAASACPTPRVETVVSHGRGIGHVFYLNWFAVESHPVAAARARELVDAVKSFDLITFYLPRLIAGKPTKDTEKFICRADVYGSEPSDLAGKFAPVPRCEKGGRLFFTSCKRHKGSSTRKERTAGDGTWVRQNSKGVKNKAGVKVGETQNFRFKDGSYTDWLMEEHHCCRQQAVAGDEEPVICRMYVSPRAPPDSAARQESAAFVQQQPAPQVSEPPCDKKNRDDVAEEAPAAA